MPIAREAVCTDCSRQGKEIDECPDGVRCKLVAMQPRFKVGDNVQVRMHRTPWEIESIDHNKGSIGAHRYNLVRILDMRGPGGTARKEFNQAYADDLTLLPAPQPAPELSLAPDPPAAYSPAQDLSDASPDAAAPAGERSAADAIRSPDAGITLNEDPLRETSEDEMQLLAEVDHTHDPEGPGEEDGPWADGWSERSGKRKKLRRPPDDMTDYHQLKDIMYSGRFKGLEDADDDALASLDTNTPVGVAATRERNGSAVWIVVVQGMLRKAVLEAFYPKGTRDESRAIEHAVMLALREVPIRTPDLEVLLLQL